MSDSFDRVVPAVLALGIAACVVAAVFVPAAPLPRAARVHWSAQGSSAPFHHIARRTFMIDATIQAGRERPYGASNVALRRGSGLGVRGWAFDPATQRSAERLVYRVDAGQWREASYHIARADVATAFGLPGAFDSGFRADVDTRVLAPGEHRIAFATVNGARFTSIPAVVRIVVTNR